jgi:hypothetical protein
MRLRVASPRVVCQHSRGSCALLPRHARRAQTRSRPSVAPSLERIRSACHSAPRIAPDPSSLRWRCHAPCRTPRVYEDGARATGASRAQLASRRPRGACLCVARRPARTYRHAWHAATLSRSQGHARATTPRSARVATRAAIARSELVWGYRALRAGRVRRRSHSSVDHIARLLTTRPAAQARVGTCAS